MVWMLIPSLTEGGKRGGGVISEYLEVFIIFEASPTKGFGPMV